MGFIPKIILYILQYGLVSLIGRLKRGNRYLDFLNNEKELNYLKGRIITPLGSKAIFFWGVILQPEIFTRYLP